MKKNKVSTFNVQAEINCNGNWNFRFKDHTPLYTKPIAVITIDQDTFVFEHRDILDLITAYHDVDIMSIEMIKKGQAGLVKTFETPLLEKILKHIKELQDRDKCIKDSKFLKKGQKELRLE